MLTNSYQKSTEIYTCEKCNYISRRKSHYDRHILTRKHKMLTNVDISVLKSTKPEFVCSCGKIYKYRQSLSVHKKTCIVDNNIEDNIEKKFTKSPEQKTNDTSDVSNDLIIKLLNDNNEMRNIIMKQQEQIGDLIPLVGNNNNNTTNNTNNFNINLFLNEHCKDAINMSEFIESIHVSLKQLDFTKENGLADGLSKTIIDNMNKLSIFERPLHCSDKKRETLYIKEDNKWERDISNTIIKTAIKKASSKNFNALKDWESINPDYINSEEKQDYFTKTISTIGKPTEMIDDKIIRKICKKTYIKDIISNKDISENSLI